MDGQGDSLTNPSPLDGQGDSLTNPSPLDGQNHSLTNPSQPTNQDIPENKAEGSDSPPDDNNRFYFLDKSADISELAELHQRSGGKADYTKWRNWNFAQEIDNKKKDKLIEQMAARLQEIEEKLQKIEKPGAE